MSECYRTTGIVQKKIWGPRDTYTTVEVQVPFKDGTRVEVLVTPIATYNQPVEDEQVYGKGGGFTPE